MYIQEELKYKFDIELSDVIAIFFHFPTFNILFYNVSLMRLLFPISLNSTLVVFSDLLILLYDMNDKRNYFV